MLGERVNNGSGSGYRCSEPRARKRLKMAGAAIWVVALFALMAVMGTANRAWAQTCGGSLSNQIQKPAGTANNGPFQPGDTVTIQATIGNNNATAFTVTDFVQKLSCQDTTVFANCTSPDDTVTSYVSGSVTTNCGVTWNVNTAVAGQVTFTPATTLTLAAGASCNLAFNETINSLSKDTTPSQIQWANDFDGNCTGPIAGGAQGSGIFTVVECSVEIDKQVSCDGGTTWLDVSGIDDTEPPTLTLSDLCIGWNAFDDGKGNIVPATNIEVRYKARNTGTVDATCSTGDTYPGAGGGAEGLTDTNLGILPAGTTVASIPASQTTYTQVVGPETVACSDTLAASEPDTAALKCQCAIPAGPTFAAPVTIDSAKFACQTPGLGVTKTCGAVDASGNAPVTVTYESSGTAPLGSCTLTDTVFAGPCVNGLPSSSTVVGSVTGIPGSLTDPTGSPTTVSGLTATGLNTTSCDGADCCNQATVTCNVTNDDSQTIQASNTADCPIASGDCFTRTPGFWGEHPRSQNLLYTDFGPVFSCGIDLNTSLASTQGSGTEDICSIGGGKNNPPQTTISNTQRQLERQCAAANMNLAVSNLREVSCEGAFPGITTLIDSCCNAADSVCNTGGDTTGCIGALDAFNNFDFTNTVPGSVDGTDFGPPGANPKQCQAAKASGFVNKRPRP